MTNADPAPTPENPGRVVLTEFISIDGVVEAPGGEDFKYPDWSFAFDRARRRAVQAGRGAELRRPVAGPQDLPGLRRGLAARAGPLAEKYNTMPKYVVSGTLTAPEWANTTVLSGDLVAEVTRLKSEISGEISVAGSIQLAHGLLAADLVDEIHLMVSPIILGHGRTLWGGPTPDKSAWRLTEATVFGDSTLLTTYRRR